MCSGGRGEWEIVLALTVVLCLRNFLRIRNNGAVIVCCSKSSFAMSALNLFVDSFFPDDGSRGNN